MRTMAEVVRTHASERGAAPAIFVGDETISFAELDRRSNQVAAALAAAGVGAGDRVAILDKNVPEWFELFFGAAKLNAVLVSVNWRLAPPEVQYIVDDAHAKVFVVGADFVPVVEAIADQLTHVTTTLVIGEHPKLGGYAAWRDGHEAVDPGVVAEASDVMIQLYSSGTTGLPKGVMLTNENLFALLEQTDEMWGFGPSSVNLVAMPLFHIGGGGWSLVGLYHGAPMVLVREVDPAAIVELVERHQVTHAFLVPAVLQFMLMLPGIAERDFSSMTTIVYGASPISTQVLTDSIRTFKCGFAQAYGLTETTGVIVTLPPADHDPDGPSAHRLRAAGLPIRGVELRIVDAATGLDVDTGEVGEIWTRTRQNMLGYWNRPEETTKTIVQDGWLRTGDVGYLDADGYLYIHDRVKDMIVSGGENIYPAEVENVLMGHPAVADCAVIGVPDDRWGETPKALVVRADGAAVDAEELIAFCRDKLARYKCPTTVEFIEAVPRNPTGKILKKDLRAPYWVGRDRNVN